MMTSYEPVLNQLSRTMNELSLKPIVSTSIVSTIAKQLLQINPNQLSQYQASQLQDLHHHFAFYLEKNRFYENEDQDLGWQLVKFINFIRTLPQLRHPGILSTVLTSLSNDFFDQEYIDHKQCNWLMTLSASTAANTRPWQIKLEAFVMSLEEAACNTLSTHTHVLKQAKTDIQNIVDDFIKEAKKIQFIS